MLIMALNKSKILKNSGMEVKKLVFIFFNKLDTKLE